MQSTLALLVGAFLAALSHAFRDPQALYNVLRRDTCGSNIQTQCTISLQDCVDAICSTCRDVTAIAQCCALGTDDLISECLADAEQGATQSSVPATATSSLISPSLSSELASPDATACLNWESAFDVCASQTPGFSTELFATKASCLCYSSSVWQPNIYDELDSSCLGFFSTASPAVYSSIVNKSDFVGFSPCSLIGDIVSSSPASVSATTTTVSPSAWPSLTTSPTSSSSESFVGFTVSPTAAASSSTTTSPVATETATSGSDAASVRIVTIRGFALLLTTLTLLA